MFDKNPESLFKLKNPDSSSCKMNFTLSKSPSIHNGKGSKNEDEYTNYSLMNASTSIHCKTPLKQVQEVEAFTTIKPSFEKRLAVSQFQRKIITLTQPKFRREDIERTADSYSRDVEFDRTISIKRKVQFRSHCFKDDKKDSTSSSISLYKKTPHFKGPDHYSEIQALSPRRKPLKRKTLLSSPSSSSSSSVFSSHQKLKRNKLSQPSSIKLSNILKNECLEFRVFRDSELGNNKVIQESLRPCQIDNDCQTESEQISRAIEQGEKELRDAIHLINLRKDGSTKEVSRISALISSGSKTERNSYNSTSVNADEIDSGLFSSPDSDKILVTPFVVKRLSFSKVEDN